VQSAIHVYEVRPRKDKRGVDLISDACSLQSESQINAQPTKCDRARGKCCRKKFLLDGKAFSLFYGCPMKPKSETQILRQAEARDVLLHGGTVDSFLRPYHPDLRFAAFRAYIGAVRDALFRPRTARQQSKRAS
jgi:hypothetical protein